MDTVRDGTARTRLLASLRQSAALDHSIDEGMDYGIWFSDADGRTLYNSESFLRMVGLTQHQCADFGWGDALHPDDAAATVAAWQECVRCGGNWNHELRFRSVDGTWRHVLARGLPVRDKCGNIIGWAGINLDITDLKEAEADLRVAKEIAEQADTAKSHFLAAASHDLRQPLSALGLYTGVLGDKVAPAEQEIVARMQECIVGLSRLLNDLLDLSKLSAGVVTARCEDFPLVGLLDNLRATHGPVAEAKGLRLRCVASRLIGRTDPVLLQRIVGNFIENALRYSQSGGVLVACRRRQGRVFVEVWDTGPGIPPDKQTEIFDEFRQLGDAAGNDGSGLGLAIAAKAAALLGLKIEVRSRLGRGSVFAIEVPPGQAPALHLSPARAAYDALRIALVEDNCLVREALETAMRQVGHQLVAAATGDELLAALASVAPDAVVSDYRLANGSNGFEVILALRAKFDRDIPAIMISGDTDPALLQSMAEHGIIMLHKPLDLEQLQACLAAAISPVTSTVR